MKINTDNNSDAVKRNAPTNMSGNLAGRNKYGVYGNDGSNYKRDYDRSGSISSGGARPGRMQGGVNGRSFSVDLDHSFDERNIYAGHGRNPGLWARGEEGWDLPGTAPEDFKNKRNYLAIMSGTVSDEDFARILKDGGEPGNAEIEDAVTILDRIKVEMAKGGNIVRGYNDDISPEFMEAATGSASAAASVEDDIQEALREAFREADLPLDETTLNGIASLYGQLPDTGNLSTAQALYMVENNMEPTVSNIYIARHSIPEALGRQGGFEEKAGFYPTEVNGYFSMAGSPDIASIRGDMEKAIMSAGLEVNEASMKDAELLVSGGIPLTPENLRLLRDIKQVSFPMDAASFAKAAAAALSDGRKPESVSILPGNGESILQKAVRIDSELDRVTAAAVDSVSEAGEEFTLENIFAHQRALGRVHAGQYSYEAGAGEATEDVTADVEMSSADELGREAAENWRPFSKAGNSSKTGSGAIEARIRLEEIRLQMTVEANISLIRRGFSIETADLKTLLDELKRERNEIIHGLTGNESRLYHEVMRTREKLPQMPVALVGEMVRTEVKITVSAAFVSGTALETRYRQAGDSYEALMTAPRADLGDSMAKAFRNVDDILRDLGEDVNDLSRRAVRILGYNSMEITTEHISAVKSTDQELRDLIKNLNPANVLQMIRDGVNPLELNVKEMSEYFQGQDGGGSGREDAREMERYSRFLHRLEKKKEISREERATYIGIFRMLNSIEKDGGRAIGALMKSGAEMSFRNLLSALRTAKHTGMDYRVDDGFEGIDGGYGTSAIDDQINSYYRSLAGEAADKASQLMENGVPSADTTLEEAVSIIRNAAENAGNELNELNTETNAPFMQDPDDEYAADVAGEYRKAWTPENQVLRLLMENEQPVNADNLQALSEMLRGNGVYDGYMKLMDSYAERRDRGKTSSDSGKTQSASALSEKLAQAGRDLVESMDAPEKAGDHFRSITESMKTSVMEMITGSAGSFMDVRSLSLMYKQVSLTASMGQRDFYQIPVQAGDSVASMNLRIIHGGDEPGISIGFEAGEIGVIRLEMAVRNGELTGHAICSTEALVEGFRTKGFPGLMSVLNDLNIRGGNMSILYSEKAEASFIWGSTSIQDGQTAVSGDTGKQIAGRMAAGDGETAPGEMTSVRDSELYRIAKVIVSGCMNIVSGI